MPYDEDLVWYSLPGDRDFDGLCQDDYEYLTRTGQYADEPIAILCDTIIHTEHSPFCNDLMCPCKTDTEAIIQYIHLPYVAGLITHAEGERIYLGQQVS